MPNLSDINYIRRVMLKHGFKLSKQLGQNFIVDPEICPQIAAMGGAEKDIGVLEIGPGAGVLTAELAARAGKVVAVELDSRLLPVLKETLAEFDNVTVINADVLKLDLHALIKEYFSGMRVAVCANLPYYITSPIIMALLEAKLPVESITVMVQKEAAERLCATLPSRQAGAVTVAARWYSEPRILLEVPPEVFLPPPDVTSAVIRLDVRKEPPVKVTDEGMFFRVVKGAFSQRRKTLLNCLSAFFRLEKAETEKILHAAGVSPTARAEQLKLEDFAAVAELLPR